MDLYFWLVNNPACVSNQLNFKLGWTNKGYRNNSIGLTLQEAMQKGNSTTGIGNFVMVMAILGGGIILILGLIFAVKKVAR